MRVIKENRKLSIKRMEAQIQLLQSAVFDQRWALNAKVELTDAQNSLMGDKIPATQYLDNHNDIIEVFTALQPIIEE